MKRNLSVKTAGDILGCSTRTIYRLLSDGELIGFHVRGSLKVTGESLELYRQRQICKFLDENAITVSARDRKRHDFLTQAYAAYNDEIKKE